MKRIRTLSVPMIALFAWFLLASLALAQSFTRCWLQGIAGFEKQHAAAESVIYSGGHSYCDQSLNGLRVYVAASLPAGASESYLYIHTNFKPADKDNALKLAFPVSTLKFAFKDGDYDVGALLANVLEGEGVATPDVKLAKNATVSIEPSVFDSFPKLTLGEVKNKDLRFLDGQGTALLELSTATGTLKRLALIAPPPPEARLYISQELIAKPTSILALRNSKFEKSEMTLLSFVHDKSTVEYLGKTLGEAGAPKLADSVPKGVFIEMLKQRKGKRVFLLAHIEGEEMHLSSDGSSKIALQEVEDIAKENGITIAILGCNSGTSESGIIASKFINSLVAAKRFTSALEAKNFMEFFERLSSADMQVVLNDQLISRLADGEQFVATHGSVFVRGVVTPTGRARVADGSVTLAGKMQNQQ